MHVLTEFVLEISLVWVS